MFIFAYGNDHISKRCNIGDGRHTVTVWDLKRVCANLHRLEVDELRRCWSVDMKVQDRIDG